MFLIFQRRHVTTFLNGYVTFCVEVSTLLTLVVSDIVAVRMYRYDIARPRWLNNQVTLWLGTPHLCHHPAKFGDYRHYDGGDIMFLKVEERYFTYLLKSAITVYL